MSPKETRKATPGQLLVMALRSAERYRVNKFQENHRRRDYIANTGRLTRPQCQRLALTGQFFGPEGAEPHPMVPCNCHGNSIELVRSDAALQLWTGLAFSDHCSDGGTNGWFAHSWVIDARGVILETCPDGTKVRQGYYGIRLGD